ncbi:MAG: hypothetical protein HYV48_04220, partial [Candidatus Omnitrophica bacterium]|nr:hypothetical protein [Candidatus Omnitrophota bacterium]
LMDNLSIKESQDVVQKFVLRKEDGKKILSFKTRGPAVLKKLRANKKLKPSSIYRCLNPLSYEEIILIFARIKNERAREMVREYLLKHKDVKLQIDGNDIKNKIGLRPGPDFKRLLDKVLYAKINGKVRTKEDELEFVKRQYEMEMI